MPDVSNLVLIGFMATGKSTIGRRCASLLGLTFCDTDTVIEQRAGAPVSAIFAESGEATFRALEAEVVQELARRRGMVLATGGGVPVNALNVARLRRTGVVVLLDLDPVEIARRATRRTTRPLLAGAPDPVARVSELLAARMPLYRAAADVVVVTTGLEADEAARKVVDAYRRACDARPRSTGSRGARRKEA